MARRATAVAAARPPRTSRVRARTRTLLLDAALRVFARKGAGAAAIHEIASEAGVANGTFYNYFRTREELLEAASLRLIERFDHDIMVSAARVADPAERLAIGARRFLSQALRDPTWGAAVLRISVGSPTLHGYTAAGLLADLRAGRRRGRLRYDGEAAAIDLVQGAVLAGMRTILEERAGAEHPSAVSALVLRALGIPAAEADEIAHRPLPPL
jgi:AcrR family transcriptional regulator